MTMHAWVHMCHAAAAMHLQRISAIKATAIADPRAVVLLLLLAWGGATTNPYGAGAASEAG